MRGIISLWFQLPSPTFILTFGSVDLRWVQTNYKRRPNELCVILWHLMSWVFYSTSTQFCLLSSTQEGPLRLPIAGWVQTGVANRLNIPCRESLSVEMIWGKEKRKRRENWGDREGRRERRERVRKSGGR